MSETPPGTGPEHSILAILTVRNEGAFLIDWLAHHRAAGFTDFLVFSNDCEDGTDVMLDRLQKMGWLTHIRNDGPHDKGPQWSALKLADRHPAKARAGWVLFLDIDEFVNIHVGDRTVPALLAALPGATAIPLTWRLFGNAGIRNHIDRPIPEQFTLSAPAVMGWPWRAAMFKTLFRNDGSYGKLGVHRPRQPDHDRMTDQRWFDGSGRRLPATFHTGRIFSDYGRDNYQLVQLNHYPLGAMDNYLVKCDRGRANRETSAFDMSYWVERNFNVVEDKSIAALFPHCEPIRRALRSDPELAALHDASITWRQRRLATLLADESYRSLYGRLLMTPSSRVLSVEEHRFLASHAVRGAKHTPEETDAERSPD
ncbi:MAG: glycosyltransferase family 2 protein [Albidovulum sp.]|uniref:glycosyltransferase family 2 protein n=1 Tax=Albidovulum sp. TaxID=1872424 RepID=UPI003CBAF948